MNLSAALAFRPGESVVISGPSGSGKSRFLRALADLDPNDGEMSLNDVSRSDFTGPEWRARVTYVAAEPGWWGDRVCNHFAEAEREAARGGLAALGLPPEALDWDVARLSTGERQRLALLRALVQQPDVLLLDEPTGPLDETATHMVEAVLAEHLQRGAVLLLITHDAAQAKRLGTWQLEVADLVVRSVGP
ncbi:MAG: ATP-binding protein [Rhodobiaceae bacterium]|nr:MAG: ATP-binding protein [Rhodobiaceae bacterium]